MQTMPGGLLLVTGAAIGGGLGYLTGLPAGPLLFALAGAAVVQRRCEGRLVYPRKLAVGTRVLIGVAAGSVASRETLSGLGSQLAWTVLLLTVLILASMGIGRLLHDKLKVDRASGLVAAAPGGIVELSNLAADLHLELHVILAIHLLRRLMVILTIAIIALQLTNA